MVDSRNDTLDSLKDKHEVQAIRREMEDIRRQIEFWERFVRRRRQPDDDDGPNEDLALADYNRCKAAEAHIEERISEIERRVAELEKRYGVNVLLN
jgi:hypothetical protein